MSADRLSELRRQRDLLQQHLAWLDREIASAAGGQPVRTTDPALANQPGDPTGASELPAPHLQPGPSPIAASSTAPTEEDAEALLAEYRVEPHDLHREVRNGCLIYLVAAFILTAVVVTGLYFALRH